MPYRKIVIARSAVFTESKQTKALQVLISGYIHGHDGALALRKRNTPYSFSPIIFPLTHLRDLYCKVTESKEHFKILI